MPSSFYSYICCCFSVSKLCLTLCDPMDCNTPGFRVHHYLPEFAQIQIHWISDANYLILCCPLLLPYISPSIRVFSNESVLRIRWPKYWSFSFSFLPLNIQGRFPSGLTGLMIFFYIQRLKTICKKEHRTFWYTTQIFSQKDVLYLFVLLKDKLSHSKNFKTLFEQNPMWVGQHQTGSG